MAFEASMIPPTVREVQQMNEALGSYHAHRETHPVPYDWEEDVSKAVPAVVGKEPLTPTVVLTKKTWEGEIEVDVRLKGEYVSVFLTHTTGVWMTTDDVRGILEDVLGVEIGEITSDQPFESNYDPDAPNPDEPWKNANISEEPWQDSRYSDDAWNDSEYSPSGEDEFHAPGFFFYMTVGPLPAREGVCEVEVIDSH